MSEEKSGRGRELLVKCKTCSELYDSGIADSEMLDDLGVTTQCPFCGRTNSTGLQSMAFTSTPNL